MSKIGDILDGVRLKTSNSQQAVYDPNYVYSPWKKWTIGLFIALMLVFIAIWLFDKPQNTTDVKTVNQRDDVVSVQPPVKSDVKASQRDRKLYRVIKVVDGDTIDVLIGGKTERLRLIGIDTPETVDPRKPVQCFGREASDKAKSMLRGKSIHLAADSTQDNRDKYDRLLRYVYLQDGTNFNKYMISEGYAHEYTYRIPYKYQTDFKAAEKHARNNDKGLWSSASCSGNTVSKSLPKSSTAAKPTSATGNGQCDPNYTPCVPKVSYDLDCNDIATSVRVIGIDVHRFDRDGDGYGCESN